MNFITETGAIISPQNQILSIVDGHPSHVDFPEDLILELHKRKPGSVFKLAHTHPIGMFELSGRDRQTLITLAFTLYPFPIRMSTITWDYVTNLFVETVYLTYLEPRSEWLKRKNIIINFQPGEPYPEKILERKAALIQEDKNFLYDKGYYKGWYDILIDQSFKE